MRVLPLEQSLLSSGRGQCLRCDNIQNQLPLGMDVFGVQALVIHTHSWHDGALSEYVDNRASDNRQVSRTITSLEVRNQYSVQCFVEG